MSLFRHRQWYIFTIISITCTNMHAEDAMRSVPTDQFTLAYQALVQAVTDLTNSPTPPTLTTLQALADVATFGANYAPLTTDQQTFLATSILPALNTVINNSAFTTQYNASDIQNKINSIINDTNTIIAQTNTHPSLQTALSNNIYSPMNAVLNNITTTYPTLNLNTNIAAYNTLAGSSGFYGVTKSPRAYQISNASYFTDLFSSTINGTPYIFGFNASSKQCVQINLSGSIVATQSLSYTGYPTNNTFHPTTQSYYFLTQAQVNTSYRYYLYQYNITNNTISTLYNTNLTNSTYPSSSIAIAYYNNTISTIQNYLTINITNGDTINNHFYITDNTSLTTTQTHHASPTYIECIIDKDYNLWGISGSPRYLYKSSTTFTNNIVTAINNETRVTLPNENNGELILWLRKDIQGYPVVLTQNSNTSPHYTLYTLNTNGNIQKTYSLSFNNIGSVFAADSQNNYWIYVNESMLAYINTSTNAITTYDLTEFIYDYYPSYYGTPQYQDSAIALTVDTHDNPWLACGNIDYLFTIQ